MISKRKHNENGALQSSKKKIFGTLKSGKASSPEQDSLFVKKSLKKKKIANGQRREDGQVKVGMRQVFIMCHVCSQFVRICSSFQWRAQSVMDVPNRFHFFMKRNPHCVFSPLSLTFFHGSAPVVSNTFYKCDHDTSVCMYCDWDFCILSMPVRYDSS